MGVVSAAAAQRARIRAAQDEMERRLRLAYDTHRTPAWHAIQGFLSQYQTALDAGEVDATWLYEQRRMAVVLTQIERAVAQYGAASLEAATIAQQRMIAAGAQDAYELLTASFGNSAITLGQLGLSFFRLPQEAMAKMEGLAGNGQPLADLFATFGPEAAAKAKADLLLGVGVGQAPDQVARALSADLDISRNRATVIARTETMRAYREAASDTYRANSDVLGGWVWLASPTACAACLFMEGSVHDLDEDMDSHAQCFPAGTMVSAANVQRAYRRWHDGELVYLTTTSGHHLRGTPNHPILTDRGWVALGLLNEGDNVICGAFDQRTGGRDPDIHDMPTEISQVFDALADRHGTERIPIRDTDFHGDGRNGDVEVVTVNRVLELGVKPARFQPFSQLTLASAHKPLLSLARKRALTACLHAFLHATASSEGISSEPAVLFGSTLRRQQAISRRASAWSNAILNQEAANAPTVDVQSRGDRLLGFTAHIGADKVVSIDRVSFHGYVFNLQTASGCYLANDIVPYNADDSNIGIVSHNCRCTQVPITRPWGDILDDVDLDDLQDVDWSDLPDTSVDVPTGEETFANMSEAQQVSVLGKAGYNAYQAGDVSLSDFADYQFDKEWGRSLYQPSLKEMGLDARDYLGADAKVGVPLPTDADRALADAQARVDALRQEYEATKAAGYTSYFAPEPEGTKEALLDLARAQAKVDLEAGGRGAILYARDVGNPFGAMDDLQAQAERIFGRQLTRDELGGLVGAPEGSYVVFRGGDSGWIITLQGPSWNPSEAFSESEYSADRYLLPTGRGNRWYMNNSGFSIREDLRASGLGSKIFADEVDTLSSLGLPYIETNAAGSGPGVLGELAESSNGYYTWPRLGYLGHLPDYSREMLQEAFDRGEVPEAWTHYTTIQQLMRTPQGRAWWKAFGQEIDGLRFDLSDGSLSRRILNRYLRS